MALKEQLAREMEKKLSHAVRFNYHGSDKDKHFDNMAKEISKILATWICENLEAYVDEEEVADKVGEV